MICPGKGGDCDDFACVESGCRYFLLAPISCLHFVGFKDDRYWNAVKTFGLPDFYHRVWDRRAREEVVPGDVAIFATGSEHDEPKPIGWDDSQQDILARGGKEFLR